MRTALLVGGLFFVVVFGLMTIAVVVDTGVDILTLTALLIVALIGAGLFGAIRNPPPQ